ncbi:peptidoglycan-binding protein [Anaerobacillus sp. HL2]|nr:peptidoglycan-binding protein [Anaerobacillus sp. HL2]
MELLTVNATGYFGPSTEEAVKAFQKTAQINRGRTRNNENNAKTSRRNNKKTITSGHLPC